MKTKIFFAILLIFVFCVATSAFAMTDAERQTLIVQLQSQIALLIQQLQQLQSQSSSGSSGQTAWCHTFNTNLKQGDSGTEVSALQTALTLYGVYSGGDTQGTFGASTKSAVAKFQELEIPEILISLGYRQGTGNVSLNTRKVLNQLYGCVSGQTDITASVEDTTITCVTNWSCSSWSACSNGIQTRTCVDANNCGIDTNKPILSQNCIANCIPNCSSKICGADDGCGGKCQTGTCSFGMICSNGQCICSSYTTVAWSCGNWSTCTNGQQTRTCTVPTGTCYKASTAKPAETQSCTSTLLPGRSTERGDCIGEGKYDNLNPDNPNCCDNLYKTKTSQYKCTGTLCKTIYTCEKPVAGKNCIGEHGGKNLSTQSNIKTDPCCSGLIYVVKPTGNTSTGTGTCEKSSFPRYNGQACTINSGCQSGYCVRGICSATSCVPDWQCTNWSVCNSSGSQTRTCTDLYNCGVTTGKPSTSQLCDNGLPSVILKISDGPGSDQNSNTGFYSYDSDGPISAIAGYSQGLKWVTKNATSCTASGNWSGTKAISTMSGVRPVAGYQRTGNLSAMSNGSPKQYTFTITCVGPGGSAQDSVVINVSKSGVIPDSPVTVDFSASPTRVNVGDSTVLRWSATGATSCTALNNWSGTKATSGSETVIPVPASSYEAGSGNVQKAYGISCYDSSGNIDYGDATVIVSPYLMSFQRAGDQYIIHGNSVTLTWSATGATSCTALGDWSGTKATSGSETVGPLYNNTRGLDSVPKTFYLSCDGPFGKSGNAIAQAFVLRNWSSASLDNIQNQLASIVDAIKNLFAR